MDKNFGFFAARYGSSFEDTVDNGFRWLELKDYYMEHARAVAARDRVGVVGTLHVQVKMEHMLSSTLFYFRFPMLAAFGFAPIAWNIYPARGHFAASEKLRMVNRITRATVLGTPYKFGGLHETMRMVTSTIDGRWGVDEYREYANSLIASLGKSREQGTAQWHYRKALELSLAFGGNTFVKGVAHA